MNINFSLSVNDWLFDITTKVPFSMEMECVQLELNQWDILNITNDAAAYSTMRNMPQLACIIQEKPTVDSWNILSKAEKKEDLIIPNENEQLLINE